MAAQTYSIPQGAVGPTPYVSPTVTLPATTTSLDIALVSSKWTSPSLGAGTLFWQVQYQDGLGQWQVLVGQGYEGSQVPPFVPIGSDGIPFGALSRGGAMPQMGLTRTGLGGLVVRLVAAATSPIQAGASITVQF